MVMADTCTLLAVKKNTGYGEASLSQNFFEYYLVLSSYSVDLSK
jgi:hypothetical protein